MEDKLLPEILKKAVENKASDIHICAGITPLIRVNGILKKLEEIGKLDVEKVNTIVEEILNDEKKKELKAEKSVDSSVSFSGIGRFRCNVYFQRNSFAVALRMLPFEIPEFETLGLPESIKKIKEKTRGLFLITGGTGSGKTTTLASIVDMLNSSNPYHITTIEDPIEYLHNHKNAFVTQREVGSDTLDFKNALRAALREDPDVIMLGEMRDPETISIALTAAETGHLVLSTLHTMGASKSIDRIIDTFDPKQQGQIRSQLATVLEGVISQNLIPRKDNEGVVVATEVMWSTPAIKNLIREGKQYQIDSILQTGQAHGMHTMENSLATLVKEDVISEEDAMNRTQDQHLLRQLINRR